MAFGPATFVAAILATTTVASATMADGLQATVVGCAQDIERGSRPSDTSPRTAMVATGSDDARPLA